MHPGLVPPQGEDEVEESCRVSQAPPGPPSLAGGGGSAVPIAPGSSARSLARSTPGDPLSQPARTKRERTLKRAPYGRERSMGASEAARKDLLYTPPPHTLPTPNPLPPQSNPICTFGSLPPTPGSQPSARHSPQGANNAPLLLPPRPPFARWSGVVRPLTSALGCCA